MEVLYVMSGPVPIGMGARRIAAMRAAGMTVTVVRIDAMSRPAEVIEVWVDEVATIPETAWKTLRSTGCKFTR